MRTSYVAAIAAFGIVCSLVACSSDTTGPTPSGSSSGGSTTSSGGSSSGGSSGGSSSGGASGGSSGTGSSSGGTVTCTAPTIPGTTTLGALNATQKGQLCDYTACPFGGYGKSKSCTGGTTVKSKASQDACTGDPTWTKCASLAVSDYLGCNDKINADPCKALETVTTDAACANFKACAF